VELGGRDKMKKSDASCTRSLGQGQGPVRKSGKKRPKKKKKK